MAGCLFVAREKRVLFRRTPHPVIVAETDNMDYIRALLYSYYTATLNPKP